MKIIALVLFLSLASCAMTFPRPNSGLQRPVVRVEYTLKQNMVNLGIATWGAVVQGVTVGIMLNKMGDEIRDGLGGMGK